MAVTRAFQVLIARGWGELTYHQIINDQPTGGKAVVTAERVKEGETPTKTGYIETLGAESILIAIKNISGANLTWVTSPKIRGTNEKANVNPSYADGVALPSVALVGSYATTINDGEEQVVKVYPEEVPYGIFVRGEAPEQTMNIETRVLVRVKARR